jgi:hypothetical protein
MFVHAGFFHLPGNMIFSFPVRLVRGGHHRALRFAVFYRRGVLVAEFVYIAMTPEDFEASLNSLVAKAIKAYETRGEGLRHGIALDKQVTVILSRSDGAIPLCGIYFNLHSPYQKNSLPKTVKPLVEKSPKPDN